MGNEVGHFNMKYWNKRDYMLRSSIKYIQQTIKDMKYIIELFVKWTDSTNTPSLLSYQKKKKIFYFPYIHNYVTNFKFFFEVEKKRFETFCIRCMVWIKTKKEERSRKFLYLFRPKSFFFIVCFIPLFFNVSFFPYFFEKIIMHKLHLQVSWYTFLLFFFGKVQISYIKYVGASYVVLNCIRYVESLKFTGGVILKCIFLYFMG